MLNYRSLLLCLSATIASFFASAQVYQSNVLFQGLKTLVLSSAGLSTPGKGVLSSGEIVFICRDHGACFFQVIYKGRNIRQSIAENRLERKSLRFQTLNQELFEERFNRGFIGSRWLAETEVESFGRGESKNTAESDTKRENQTFPKAKKFRKSSICKTFSCPR